jgi:Glycosyl transferase family group 2
LILTAKTAARAADQRRDGPSTRHFSPPIISLFQQLFPALGGFDTGWTRAAGEDRDLCDRLIASGYRLMYAPEALVRHAHFLKFRTFWGQHFNYGRGAYRLHQLRARRDARSIRIESLAFYLSMIGYPFARTPYRRAVVLAALIGVAQLATAAGLFLERSAQGRHLELL